MVNSQTTRMFLICTRIQYFGSNTQKRFYLANDRKNALRDILRNLAKYDVFEALDLMKEASFHLFDTFPAKIKDKTFI